MPAIDTQNTQLPALLDERDLARLMGLSLSTIRRWRLRQRGPKFIKLQSAVRYRPEDLAHWLATRPSGGDCLEV
jgi:predicted DNA-binding transcriptional regulator AlpA